MKVLHIIDSLRVGGAERLLVSFIKNAVELDHHIITLADNNPLEKELPANCKITSLHFVNKFQTLKCARAIRRYVHQEGIDVVHSHLVLSNIIARMATPKHVPVFNSLHNLNGKKFFSGFLSGLRWAELLTYKKRHHLIAVSEAVLNDYQDYFRIKGSASVLHNFVDDGFFAAAPKQINLNPGILRMVAVGSFKPQKNFQYLLEAFQEMPSGVTLDIYGDGPLRQELEQYIAKHNLPVRLCGIRSDIEKLLHNYDLFVMSSLYEGHPIALVEATAAGLPAAVADIPVLREALGNGGLYFDLQKTNSFVALTQQILSGEIDINQQSAYNWSLARRTAGKEQYIYRLTGMYRDATSPKQVEPAH